MGEVQGCLILGIGLTIIGVLTLTVGTILVAACQLLSVDATSPIVFTVIALVAIASSIRTSLWIMDKIPIK
jgi:hypothetical protein